MTLSTPSLESARRGMPEEKSYFFFFYSSFFRIGRAIKSALRRAILFPDSRRQIAEVFRRCIANILQYIN